MGEPLTGIASLAGAEPLLAAGRHAGAIASLARRMLEVAGLDVPVLALAARDLRWLAEHPGRVAPLAAACLGVADGAGLVYADARVACVYSLRDPATRLLVEEAEVQEGCRAIGVGLGIPGPSDLGLVEDILVDRAFLDDRHHSALELGTLGDLGSRTPQRILDALAAAALARAAAAPPGAVRAALLTGSEHAG